VWCAASGPAVVPFYAFVELNASTQSRNISLQATFNLSPVSFNIFSNRPNTTAPETSMF
jgi:hypothetical protein